MNTNTSCISGIQASVVHLHIPNSLVTLCQLNSYDVYKQGDTSEDVRGVDLDRSGLCGKCQHKAKIMRMLDYAEKGLKKAKIVHMPHQPVGITGPTGSVGPHG